MSRFVKLPENLKDWKIISRLSENSGNDVYKITKKEYDGTSVTANLRHIILSENDYTSDNIDFITEEANFIKSISKSGDCFNYIDVSVVNNPVKEKIELFIITEDLKSLKEVMNSKSFDETEIIDFGIMICSILETLEANNIYHGNLNTENIFITSDNKYKIGGFSDFESQISDFSFVAPEIYNKENADFTTDIYSLGLIMYYMSNEYNLPFESKEVTKDDAIKLRFDGKSVSAPLHGSEKLKSLTVIACQANSDNRWKNASNIKNALTSIKNEIMPQNKDNIIIPETTDFNGNVFEEYEYEDFTDSVDAESDTSSLDIKDENIISAENNIDDTSKNESEFEPQESNFEINDINEIKSNDSDGTSKTEEIISESEAIEDSSIPEENIEIFDNFEVSEKTISFKEKVKERDYGNYFDENNTEVSKNKIAEKTEFDIDDDKKYNVFDNETDNDYSLETNNNKKNTAIIIICIIIMLAALGFVTFCIISGISDNSNEIQKTTTNSETTIATEITTIAPTTIPATTIAPTTVVTEKNVISVVGYGYSYAKKLLEQDGFVVEIGVYENSSEWPEGYVISQSPNGDTSASVGSVVTLNISLGPNEDEVEETTVYESETSVIQTIDNNKNDDYIFANSSTSYLSKSDITSLSRENLNLALNEIYARRGRIFKDASLSAYFNSKSWYEPKYTSEEFSKNVTFNKYEEANLNLIINLQKEKGYR